jgi:hypothetical protein
MWDPAGGGNGATSNAVYDTTDSKFGIWAYLDTRNLPALSNPAGTGRGSEVTIYGIGSGDALTNLTDIGNTGIIAPTALPAAESANGFTGVAWVYERVAETAAGLGDVHEVLYLVDANDGGDSDTGGNTALDWTVLASFNLNATNSGWFNLSIDIDSAGNGVAKFGSNVVNFTSGPLNSGAFNVGYREFLTIGGDATPDAFLRPATYTIPEPATLGAVAGVAMMALRRRKA